MIIVVPTARLALKTYVPGVTSIDFYVPWCQWGEVSGEVGITTVATSIRGPPERVV
jgi:hypothetical protein